MKMLFLTKRAWPEIGGVETHVRELVKNLRLKGNSVKIISEADIRYPHIKFLGLLFIWYWFFRNRILFKNADVVHCHDIFIWYLPFRFFFPTKKVYTTFHGWEEKSPFSLNSFLQKRLAVKLSDKTIGVGKFLEKYLKVKFDLITYGATTTLLYSNVVKKQGSIVYVGRLEENTGLLQFLDWLKNNNKYRVDFCGDGDLRSECEKYGAVHGFTNPAPFYKKAEYCAPGGYLAALEALQYNCKLKLFWNNKIKEDYWKMSPFVKKDVKKWAKDQTWDKLANEYISLYNNTK